MNKILFVDDEESTHTMAKLILSKIEDDIIYVYSGEEAIDIMSDINQRQNIKLVLLDLTMPEITGIDVLKWMKKNKIKITTVIQTGITDENVIDESFKLGATDIINKPYKNQAVYNSITKYFGINPSPSVA